MLVHVSHGARKAICYGGPSYTRQCDIGPEGVRSPQSMLFDVHLTHFCLLSGSSSPHLRLWREYSLVSILRVSSMILSPCTSKGTVTVIKPLAAPMTKWAWLGWLVGEVVRSSLYATRGSDG